MQLSRLLQTLTMRTPQTTHNTLKRTLTRQLILCDCALFALRLHFFTAI